MDRKKIFFTTLFSTFFLILFVIILSFILIVAIAGEFVGYNFLIASMIVYVFNGLTSFWILNSKKRITNVKMCWIFVINFLPLFGLFAFYIFGLIPFKIKSTEEIKKLENKFSVCENYEFTNEFFSKKENLEKFGESLFIYNYSNTPIYKNNNVKILDQSEVFKSSIEAIRKAKNFIHVQYYIITDSAWFFFLIDELIKKVNEGVKVRFMFDWAGSNKRFKRSNINYMKKNGIEVEIFNPEGFNRYTSITNFRSHRKLLIVDNQICITGGSNIGDEYVNLRKKYDNWRDLNFLIEGEIVNTINLRFCSDWIYYTNYKKYSNSTKFYKDFNKFDTKKNLKNNMICQVIDSSPEFDVKLFQTFVNSKLNNAKKSVWIFTPYLLMPEEIINKLIYIGIKGVDVRIMVPHYPDNKKFILASNRSSYERLLNANIKIYEYKGFLHSKAIIIDDDQAIIGTNNMDFRSLMINFETGILVISKKFNEDLKSVFLNDQKSSIFITKEYLKTKMKLKTKIFVCFINTIHPLL